MSGRISTRKGKGSLPWYIKKYGNIEGTKKYQEKNK